MSLKSFFLKKRFFVLIGIILFLFILTRIDLLQTMQLLSRINLFFLAASMLVGIVTVFIKGFRFKLLMKGLGASISWLESAKFFFIGFFLSALTPARAGDFARAFYVRKKLRCIGEGLGAVAVDRIIDVVLLFAFAIISVLLFSVVFNVSIFSLLFLFVFTVLFVLLLFLFLNKRFVRVLLKPFFGFLVPEKFKDKMKQNFEAFFSSIMLLFRKRGIVSIAFLLGLVSWFFSIFSAFLLGLALNIPLSYHYFLIIPITGLLDLLPVSISGIGTRDAAVIFLFSFFAIKAELAVAFSLAIFLSAYVFLSAIGFLLFLGNPIKIELN